jgi:hypothetical protein
MGNQPSPEAIKRMISFFKETSLPRIIKRENERLKNDRGVSNGVIHKRP